MENVAASDYSSANEHFRELLRAAQAGDPGARNQLARLMRVRLAKTVEHILGHKVCHGEGASDVVQIAVSNADQHLLQFEGQTEEELNRWLDAIARNEARNHWRRARTVKRGQERQQPLPQDSGGEVLLADDTTSPSQQAAGHEAQEMREAALRQLSPDYQQAIHLRFNQRLGWPEVAAQMGRNQAAAERLYFRAIAKWRQASGGST